jgi:hypothetical protein
MAAIGSDRIRSDRLSPRTCCGTGGCGLRCSPGDVSCDCDIGIFYELPDWWLHENILTFLQYLINKSIRKKLLGIRSNDFSQVEKSDIKPTS